MADSMSGDDLGLLNVRLDGGNKGRMARRESWRTLLHMRRELAAGKTAPLTSKH